MEISHAGLAFIANEEGEVLHTYNDSVGVRTIGIGHALRPGESYPNGITHDQAIAMLTRDAMNAEGAINSRVTVKLTQNQFDALTSFTFNLGVGALEGSTLLKLLNLGNYAGAANEFPKWCHAGGKVDPVISARRQREMKVFNTLDPVAATIAVPTPVTPEPGPVSPPIVLPVPVDPTPIGPALPPAPPSVSFIMAILGFFAKLFGGGK